MSYPSFASGEVLTAADMNAVGLWLVKTQTVGTGVSSVTVTGAFSSTYDNYKIVYTNGFCSAQGDLKLTLGSTATGYYQNAIYTAWNNTVAAASTLNGSSWERAGVAETTGRGNTLQLDIYNPNLALRTVIWGSFVGTDSTRVGGSISGFLSDATQYTAFTIAPSTGTITGGTIRVYGYRN